MDILSSNMIITVVENVLLDVVEKGTLCVHDMLAIIYTIFEPYE